MHTFVKFGAHKRHCTLPWKGGRLILAAVVVKDFAGLSATAVAKLEQSGFLLPKFCTRGAHPCEPPIVSPLRKPFLAPTVPVIFEIFCGSGRFTVCLRRLGISAAHGIDHVTVENAAVSPLIADLATEDRPDLAMFWITNPLLSAVLAAPCCVTCS